VKHLVFALGVATVFLGALWFASGSKVSKPPAAPETGPTNVSPTAVTTNRPASLRAKSTIPGSLLMPDPSSQETLPWIERFKKSLASAKDDGERAALVEKEARKCFADDDLARARLCIEAGRSLIHEPGAIAKLDRQQKEGEIKEAEENVRVVAAQKEIEATRVQAQLEFMRECLQTAKAQKKPPQDIRSLEAVVKKLELEVKEEK
jgi:hypothetical protein